MNPMIPAQPMPFALTPDAYRQLKHAASLKGLSKPFKGKGGVGAPGAGVPAEVDRRHTRTQHYWAQALRRGLQCR